MSYPIVDTKIAPLPSYNQGLAKKTQKPVRPAGCIFVPAGYTFSSANTATATAFLTALAALVANDSPSLRAYVFTFFEDLKTITNDSQKETLPFGGEFFLARGIPGYQGRIINGGMDMFKNLLKMHNAQSQFDLLWFDKAGVVGGTNRTPNSGRAFGGYSLRQIFIPGWTMPDASKDAMFEFYLSMLNAEQVNEFYDYVDTGVVGLGAALKPLCDFKIVATTGPGANKISIQLFAGYSQENLYGTYPDALNAAANFTATKVSDGTTGTISACAKNAALQGWDLTITSGTGLAYNIGAALPSVLTAAGVTNSLTSYEWVQNAYSINTDNQATAA